MKFLYQDLGHRNRGEIVQITLTSGANVRLMDSSNFNNYKNGRKHRFTGGLARKSPVNLAIPSSGRWYACVDMQGLRGSTRASFRMLPAPLPELRERPLADIPSLVRDIPPAQDSESQKNYDVFISHASEDKELVVRDLANALKNKSLSVWYDEFELKIGDSLRKKIDLGLSKSRFGIVVFSKHFFDKGWTNYELDGIVTRSVNNEQILLPIWHEVTKQDVINFSPSLADKVARSTATHTVDEIAQEIFEVIKPSN